MKSLMQGVRGTESPGETLRLPCRLGCEQSVMKVPHTLGNETEFRSSNQPPTDSSSDYIILLANESKCVILSIDSVS